MEQHKCYHNTIKYIVLLQNRKIGSCFRHNNTREILNAYINTKEFCYKIITVTFFKKFVEKEVKLNISN